MGFHFGLSANAQWVLASTAILGMAAGVIGSFAFWKRHSLLSDVLAHAALPGVVIGFLVAGGKNLPMLLLGAGLSALAGALFIQWIRSSTRIKEDTAMGLVLSVFFGCGIMLLTMASRSAGGGQSGLDNFIFGQAAAMVREDVAVMAVLALAVLLIVLAAYKEWKLFLFDPAFAKGLGLPLGWMNGLYLALLVLVIVIGIQAVGVILISALLIIPGVSARYWTHSFGKALVLAALFGGGAGAAGTLASVFGSGWPTGPFIVIAAGSMFFVSLLFGSKQGIAVQAVRQWAERRRSGAMGQIDGTERCIDRDEKTAEAETGGQPAGQIDVNAGAADSKPGVRPVDNLGVGTVATDSKSGGWPVGQSVDPNALGRGSAG